MHNQEMPPAALTTIRDFVRWGASRFQAAGLTFGHGTSDAWEEAAYLVAHALHLSPGIPAAYLGARLTAEERRAVAMLLMRRVDERRPAAYLTGEAWLAGMPFHVDERVLVPRSPIAELLEGGVSPWLDEVDVQRVLDIGTGCGCLAALAASAFPEAHVDAVDVDPKALEVAATNLARHELDDRVTLLEGNLYAPVRGRRYELVIANPPYVDAATMARLPAEYRVEPAQGLAAGEDGLACALPILAGAAGHLAEHGVLVLEVGASRDALVALLPGVPWVWVELARGGEGVLAVTRDVLAAHASDIGAAAAVRR